MSNNLLQKLIAAQTDEERSWIVTENLLKSLPTELATALWAAAIPHWFDADILAALCPELTDRAEELYRQLQTISCVEVFADRGHNVHELTRNHLLDHLWQDNPERFRDLSRKAAAYFTQGNKPEIQIERIYHLLIAEPENENGELFNLAQLWSNSYRKAELESLIFNLQQHIAANRVTVAVRAEATFWDGKIKFRFYQHQEALERYEAALALYHEIDDRLGEANTLQEIGDVFQFFKRSTEALQKYEVALVSYHEIGDHLGEANTLKAIGDVFQFLDRRTEALERYELALVFYREIDDHLGEANTLKEIGDILQFFKKSTEALEKYEAALLFYRETCTWLGEANTLKAIGDVFQFLDRRTEALESYKAALSFYREIGARLGEANILKAITVLEENPRIALPSTQNNPSMHTKGNTREPIILNEPNSLNEIPAKVMSKQILQLPLEPDETVIRERARFRLVTLLIHGWVVTIIAVFIIIVIDKYIYYSTPNSEKINIKEQSGTKDLITLVLTTQSTLVGAALGFYFGSRDTK